MTDDAGATAQKVSVRAFVCVRVRSCAVRGGVSSEL